MRRNQSQSRSFQGTREFLPLPTDTFWVAGKGERCTNIGLWLDRYLPVDENWKLTGSAKRREQVFQLVNSSQIEERIEALEKRQESLQEWYRLRYGQRAVSWFDAKPTWRFVVGLGAAHVLETDITLHRIFGLPIIPASSLKGAARAYAQIVEGKAGSDGEFNTIFGTNEQAGEVTFLDAIPIGGLKFTLDIMNPHYPDYYRTEGTQAPSDWQSPNPVPFLTVSETSYRFTIVARTEKGINYIDTARRWLWGALAELGIGAKTSADYGYWTIRENKP